MTAIDNQDNQEQSQNQNNQIDTDSDHDLPQTKNLELNEEIKRLTLIKDDMWQARPLRMLEKAYRLLGIYSLPDWKQERFAWTKDISSLLYKEMFYAFEDQSNTVASIYAPPGEGKSTIAKSICSNLKKMARNILKISNNKIYLTYNFFQTLEAIKKSHPGDIILQDENTKLSGQGANSTVIAIFNILKNFRKKQISVLIVSPELITMKSVVNFVLYAFDKHRKKRANRVLVLSGETLHPLGYAVIPIREDKDFVQYDDFKDENIDDIVTNMGMAVVRYPKYIVEKHVNDVWDYMIQEFQGIEAIKWKTKFIATIIQLIPIAGDTNYRKIIENKVALRIEILKLREEQRKEEEKKKREELALEKAKQESLQVSSSLQNGQSSFDQFLSQIAMTYLVSINYVNEARLAQRWVLKKLSREKLSYKEIADLTDEKRTDTVQKWFRRTSDPDTTSLGSILELALSGYLTQRLRDLYSELFGPLSSQDTQSFSFSFQVGSGPGLCDVFLVADSDPATHLVCINAKLKLERRPSWSVLCQPEYEHNPHHSYLALWDPEHGLIIEPGESTEQTVPAEKNRQKGESYEDIDSFLTKEVIEKFFQKQKPIKKSNNKKK